jgi:hypothetical protein
LRWSEELFGSGFGGLWLLEKSEREFFRNPYLFVNKYSMLLEVLMRVSSCLVKK